MNRNIPLIFLGYSMEQRRVVEGSQRYERRTG